MKWFFQYPQSDRGRCNAAGPACGWGLAGPFSILSRIVGAATVGGGARDGSAGADFQYPQSDRGRCNVARLREISMLSPLSVSSVGSWALQLYVNERGRVTGFVPFSILSRIVGAATRRAGPYHLHIGKLSVSSVGSWALQRGRGLRHHCRVRTFQYPQSDRGRCNQN